MHLRLALLTTLATALAGAAPSQDAAGKLLPAPRQMVATAGRFPIDARLVIRHGPTTAAHAAVLREEIELLTGIAPRTANADASVDAPCITLQVRASDARDALGLPVEAYTLRVGPDEIQATAASTAGLSWATTSLLQAIELGDEGASVRCGTVRDEPRAPFRSVSVDVARSPHSLDALRGVVRLARLYKIRFVQLHLTDDQHFTYPFPPVTDALQNNAVFDRAGLEELVAYADARGVTLIPEIDMPGHTRRLIESGYLEGAKGHADVAHERYAEPLAALLDDVMGCFASSPYFHIGGDESGAGSLLVPFLERTNRHVRSRGKRLVVWEGFHGAPTDQLPASGDDRILVAAWESSYNAPWDLLAAGYELINASWSPLYIVGGDSRIHPGTSAGRSWSPAVLATWNKDRFMHWEPGRPVFEDRGPKDTDRDDGIWDVPEASWRRRILGGQISVWEQRESSLLRDLRPRVPVLAERLWNGAEMEADELLERGRSVDSRLGGLVQPIEVRFASGNTGALERVAHAYTGDEIEVSFVNRTRLEGRIRWSTRTFQGDWNWIDFGLPEAPASSDDTNRITFPGMGSIRAALFRPDGSQVGSETWARCVNWPMRVAVTEYDVGRRVPAPGSGRDGGRIPDFDRLGDGAVTARYELPMLRGPLDHTGVKGQRFEATLRPAESGEFEIGLKTQSGHAMLWLDLDGDGKFEASERLVPETPNSEERLVAKVTLKAGSRYPLRVDHVAALPRPVVLVSLDRPGAERPREITRWLAPRGR